MRRAPRGRELVAELPELGRLNRPALLLRLDIEIFESIRRQVVRQDAKDDDLLVLRQVENDFGNVGRNVLRAHYEGGKKHDIQIVAINDLGKPETNAHLTRYDTAHGKFPGTVAVEGDEVVVLAGKDLGRRGTIAIRPSACRLRMASRIVPRLTPNSVAMAAKLRK